MVKKDIIGFNLKTKINKKFLQGPGAVFSKRAHGRRRQKIKKFSRTLNY
jgi:hypothetical protein